MRKIVVGAMVSMDGVMQAPGGPTEDPTKGFKFGGWVMLDHVFKNFDLLLGRKTYEIFAAYWPYQDEDAPHGGIASCSRTSRSTRCRAQARSTRAGRAQCACATSPT